MGFTKEESTIKLCLLAALAGESVFPLGIAKVLLVKRPFKLLITVVILSI